MVSVPLLTRRRQSSSRLQLHATHLYCVCHALDLRYLEFAFKDKFNPSVLESLSHHFGEFLDVAALGTLASKIRSAIWRRLEQTTSVDLAPRWEDAFAFVSSLVLDALATSSSTANPLSSIARWRTISAAAAVQLTRELRDDFFAASTSPTSAYLGRTRSIYDFVRETVGVKARRGDVFLGRQEKTIGSNVALIYEAIRSGRINAVLVKAMQ